jgi:hypothetical protein
MERPTTNPAAAPELRPPDGHPAFLPSDVDPTIFDEDFLRRLERLSVLVRRPVRGGLKGGRRSVKRGQSVEFADYRDYALGDDLRQLDWNVYARLEKLLVKLFIEEEDSPSPSSWTGRPDGSGTPDKLVFAKRAAAALGTSPSPRRIVSCSRPSGGRTARRRAALRLGARSASSPSSAIQPAAGPDRLRRPVARPHR